MSSYNILNGHLTKWIILFREDQYDGLAVDSAPYMYTQSLFFTVYFLCVCVCLFFFFCQPSSDAQDKQCGTWRLKITPVDYLLGVADLTGELMRMCINSVGNGDIDTPFEVSQFLRQVYDGFSFIGNTGPYEVSKKLYTLKQSLAKVENACYALKVRGSEIPKHMLADVFSVKTEMIDQEEGISQDNITQLFFS